MSNHAISLLLICSASGILPVYAHEANDTTAILNDTAHSSANISYIGGYNNNSEPESNADDSVEYTLLNDGSADLKNTVSRKALFHFLKSFRLKKGSRDKRLAHRLYNRLARVFVKMKIYPLAMQCYANTLPLSEADSMPDDSSTDVSFNRISFSSFSKSSNALIRNASDEEDGAVENILPVKYKYDTLPEKDFDFFLAHNSNNNSEPVSNSYITEAFNDGKRAIAYAVIFHVKQPVSGKRKPFTGFNNVGHMFITLIKYNTDSSYGSRSFGFYPQKDNLLSATPISPVATPVFKDDALHDWDEAVGKFISRKRFEKIIRLIMHFEYRNYHLNKNNCTDFGLYAAAVAGVTIKNTYGSWPLGSGNNPANAGQSILEGKFMNTDTQNKQGLFICADVVNKEKRNE